jgi:hypothetical protein
MAHFIVSRFTSSPTILIDFWLVLAARPDKEFDMAGFDVGRI